METELNRTELKPRSIRGYNFIGRCPVKGCNSILQITIPAKVTNHTRNINYRPGGNLPPIYETFQKSEPAWHPYNLLVHCAAHHRQIGWRQVDGKISEHHVCDVRCTSARGHNCECSCGGENHGKDHAI